MDVLQHFGAVQPTGSDGRLTVRTAETGAIPVVVLQGAWEGPPEAQTARICPFGPIFG